MTLPISERLDAVAPSVTLAITAKAKRLRKQGVDIISFGAGEPDFDTPSHIKESAAASLDQGISKYTNVRGIDALRSAVATSTNQCHGTSFSADNVIVNCGAKHSLFNICMTLLNPSDEVIVLSPYWVSYPDMVRIAGGVPKIVTTSDSFEPQIEKIADAVTSKTKAIILNTPSNPTGAVYAPSTLRDIAKLCLDKGIVIIADDIYRHLVYGDTQYQSIARLCPDIVSQTIFVDGVSKAYAMTGWRIGYTVADTNFISAMAKVQGQSTSNPAHISQVAALAALQGPQDCIETMKKSFNERRIAMCELLRSIPAVSCATPGGAFYAFPKIAAYLGKKTAEGKTITTDAELCDYAIDKGVACVPGSGFGAPGYIRLSYACSLDDIKTGLSRLKTTLLSLA